MQCLKPLNSRWISLLFLGVSQPALGDRKDRRSEWTFNDNNNTTMLSSRISPTFLLLTTMAIVTGESFVQFWFFVYSRVMSGEIRLVTLHHLKEKSLLLPPPFWRDSWSLSVNHCECSEWPLSKAVYFNHPVLTANFHPHNTFGLVEAGEALSRSF